MLVAPIRPGAVLTGKLLTSLVLGALSMVVLAVATHFLIGAHWGNVLGVAILIATGVLAATCVMTLVATLAKTPDQAQSWQAMVALVLGMLGGAFFPVAQAGGVTGHAQPGRAAGLVHPGRREHDRRSRCRRGARAGRRDASLRRDRGHAGAHAGSQVGGAMKALAIAATDLRRLLRWRANIFFLFVLPLLIILLLGSVYGGAQTARIGVLDHDNGALARQFTRALAARPSTRLVTYRTHGCAPEGGGARRCRRGSADPRRLRRSACARGKRRRSVFSPVRARSPSSCVRPPSRSPLSRASPSPSRRCSSDGPSSRSRPRSPVPEPRRRTLRR